MAGLKKLAGAYMVVLAVVVAVYFIINTVLGESIDGFDERAGWYVLDVLMLIGLVLALVFNCARKREEDGERLRRGRHPSVPGGQPGLLPHRRRHHSVPAQLVVAAGPRRGQSGWQPSGLDHLGVRGRDAAPDRGYHRLPPLVRGVQFLTDRG